MEEPEPGVRGSLIPILPCSFGSQQVVEGFELGGLIQLGVAPQAHRLISDEGIDKALRIVDPDMAAPPLLGIL